MCRYALDCKFPSQVEDLGHVVSASNCQFVPIGMEVRAQDGVVSAQLVYTLTSAQVPHHAPAPKVPRENQGSIWMKTQSMNFLDVSLLVADFLQLHGVPDTPGFIVGGCEESASIRIELCGVDPVSMSFEFDTLLFLLVGVVGPQEYLSIETACQNVRREGRDLSYPWVQVDVAHFVHPLQQCDLLTEVVR